jgi:hypothetical protein
MFLGTEGTIHGHADALIEAMDPVQGVSGEGQEQDKYDSQ